jgi:predicted metalloprotease with PDZ domain
MTKTIDAFALWSLSIQGQRGLMFHYESDKRHLIISKVLPDSQAAVLGLRVKDVVVAINKEDIKTLSWGAIKPRLVAVGKDAACTFTFERQPEVVSLLTSSDDDESAAAAAVAAPSPARKKQHLGDVGHAEAAARADRHSSGSSSSAARIDMQSVERSNVSKKGSRCC